MMGANGFAFFTEERTYMHSGREFYADVIGTEGGVEEVGLDHRSSGLPVHSGVPIHVTYTCSQSMRCNGKGREEIRKVYYSD